jgi:hypothetical protein
MKIFTDKQGYPHNRHLCTTEPCSIIFVSTNALTLEIPTLFYFKFSTKPEILFYSESQSKKFFKYLEKEVKKYENEEKLYFNDS